MFQILLHVILDPGKDLWLVNAVGKISASAELIEAKGSDAHDQIRADVSQKYRPPESPLQVPPLPWPFPRDWRLKPAFSMLLRFTNSDKAINRSR
jgi:hypothetical protein